MVPEKINRKKVPEKINRKKVPEKITGKWDAENKSKK